MYRNYQLTQDPYREYQVSQNSFLLARMQAEIEREIPKPTFQASSIAAAKEFDRALHKPFTDHLSRFSNFCEKNPALSELVQPSRQLLDQSGHWSSDVFDKDSVQESGEDFQSWSEKVAATQWELSTKSDKSKKALSTELASRYKDICTIAEPMLTIASSTVNEDVKGGLYASVHKHVAASRPSRSILNSALDDKITQALKYEADFWESLPNSDPYKGDPIEAFELALQHESLNNSNMTDTERLVRDTQIKILRKHLPDNSSHSR